jgi:hypothetical protein
MLAFEHALAADGRRHASYLLQHSVPGVSGLIVQMDARSPLSYLNHSHNGNVKAPYHFSDVDRLDRAPGDLLPIVAVRDIAAGEELGFDYNTCAGYDIRDDPTMLRFLELCSTHGEEKRPSRFR